MISDGPMISDGRSRGISEFRRFATRMKRNDGFREVEFDNIYKQIYNRYIQEDSDIVTGL